MTSGRGSWSNVGAAFDLVADAHAEFVDRGPLAAIDIAVRERLLAIAESGPGAAADLGCGAGADAEVLIAHGWTVHLIDASARMLALAEERLRASSSVRFRRDDALESLRSDHERYDLGLLIGELLAYVERPEELLRALHARLQGGARVLGTYVRRQAILPRLSPADVLRDDGVVVTFVERDKRCDAPALVAKAFEDAHLARMLEHSVFVPIELVVLDGSARGAFVVAGGEQLDVVASRSTSQQGPQR